MPKLDGVGARWTRVHSWLGLGPLAFFAIYHVVTLWPALGGRHSFAAYDAQRAPGLMLGVGALAFMLVHAAIGLRSAMLRLRVASGEAREPLVAFQLFTGLLLLAFVAYHVCTVTWVAEGPQLGAHAAYDDLLSSLGQPTSLLIYIVGVSALVFHLGTGFARALGRLLPDAKAPVVRVVVGAASLVLWLAYLQLVAHFAVGEALFP
jgi:succinate dehydrogenase/fumarate reductase cytochrome b subunit